MANDVGVNLTQGNQRPKGRALSGARACTKFLQEGLAIALHCYARIVFSKAEIEIAFAIDAGRSADASRETMYQPWQLFELTRAQRRDCSFLGRNAEHRSIIKDTRYASRLWPIYLALRAGAKGPIKIALNTVLKGRSSMSMRWVCSVGRGSAMIRIMFENFTATDRWTKKPVHCAYQCQIVAISTRHADAVDYKFLVGGNKVWVALPHPAWVEYKKRTGKTITDSLAVEIAGHFLKTALESGEGLGREIYSLTVEETLAHLQAAVAEMEAQPA